VLSRRDYPRRPSGRPQSGAKPFALASERREQCQPIAGTAAPVSKEHSSHETGCERAWLPCLIRAGRAPIRAGKPPMKMPFSLRQKRESQNSAVVLPRRPSPNRQLSSEGRPGPEKLYNLPEERSRTGSVVRALGPRPIRGFAPGSPCAHWLASRDNKKRGSRRDSAEDELRSPTRVNIAYRPLRGAR